MKLRGNCFEVSSLRAGFSLSAIAAAFAMVPSALHALPANGTPAPPLHLTQLLQAPEAARATWPALRGKVVVLEFWATWCGPCVAAVSHLNRLARSLDPAKVLFLSIDDEDPKVVQTFLTKRKMEGWVGIDTTGAVFKRYGVTVRPTTIVVDPRGHIAQIAGPDTLNSADLLAVAAGKTVKLVSPPSAMVAAAVASSPAAPAVKPLFEISLSNAAPGEQTWMSTTSTGTDLHGADAEWLLTYAYNVSSDRLLFAAPKPDGRYDLHTEFGAADPAVTTPMLQAAVAAGLHFDIRRKTVTRSVYVLKATEAAQKLLTPTASTRGSETALNQGKLSLVNSAMADLASSLEDWTDTPVIDETGILTKFDAELQFSTKDLDALNSNLREHLGVELHREERPVEMIEINVPAPVPPRTVTISVGAPGTM